MGIGFGKKNDEMTGRSAIDDMGLLKNESPSEGLFEKMGGNAPNVDSNQFDPVQAAAIAEQDAIEKERQERESARAYLQKYNSLSDNYLLGFVGAMVGGLVGAIPWAIASSAGWFVAWLGYLIAVAASKGYDFMKVKVSVKKIWFVAIAVIVGVFAGELLGNIFYIAKEAEFAAGFGEIFTYIIDNFEEYMSNTAPNLVLGMVFGALGGYSALKEIKDETSTIKALKEKYPEDADI